MQVVEVEIGVVRLIGVVFVTLKLTGFINWSWWWVTLPFWGGYALAAVLLTMFGLICWLKGRK